MKVYIYFVLFTLFTTITFTQQKNQFLPKAPMVLENPSSKSTNSSYVSDRVLPDGNYVLVDSMPNAFGLAVGTINPLVFDPYSGVLALAHRGAIGYAAGSGEVWYNISTNFGLTWTRVPAAINAASSTKSARYPNMTISNPTHGNINVTNAIFSWAEISSVTGTFETIGYGGAQPVGGNSPIAFIYPGSNYSANVPCWVSDNNSWYYWMADNIVDDALDLWRTQDYITVNKSSPPSWGDSVFVNGNSLMGGASFNGVQYVGVLGTYLVPNPPSGGWSVGYSKSTDNGQTWSPFNICEWRNIPSLARFDELFDYKKFDQLNSMQGDIHVDANGKVHLIVQLTDTTINSNTGSNAVVDLYETSTGWNGNIIFEGLDEYVYNHGPGIGQMGPSSYIAFDSARQVMAVQWVNKSTNSEFADIFIAYKSLNDSVWSVPINLTNSPNINNTQSHLAPYLRKTGNSYTAFSMYGYVKGLNAPYGDTTQITNIYAAPVTFDIDVPVELTTFKADINKNNVTLNWVTATEKNNYGFQVERKEANGSYIDISFIPGAGTTTKTKSYSFTDKNVKTGNYTYRLKQIDYDGAYEYSSELNLLVASPVDFSLNQNYPNPFNPSTVIGFFLPENCMVKLLVYDILGQSVYSSEQQLAAGENNLQFNAINLNSGVYIYKIDASGVKGNIYSSVKKMILTK